MTTTRRTTSKAKATTIDNPILPSGMYLELVGPQGAVRVPLFPNGNARDHEAFGTYGFGRTETVERDGRTVVMLAKRDAYYHKGPGLDLVDNLPTRAALRVVSADAQRVEVCERHVRQVSTMSSGIVDAAVFQVAAGKFGDKAGKLTIQVSPGSTRQGDPRWRIATVRADVLLNGQVKTTQATPTGIGVISADDLTW